MHRAIRLLPHSLLLLLLTVVPAGAQEYGVQPGDRILIGFFTGAGESSPEITGERTVDRDGNLFLPLIGTVDVEGLDAAGIRTRIEERYGAIYPGAVVQVTVSLRVSVTGAVGQPGVFYLDPSTTVVQAIAVAGGGQDQAGSQNVRLQPDYGAIRIVRGNEVLQIDLNPANPDRDDLQVRIQSGDWYFVPTSSSTRSIRDNVAFWGQLATLALTVVVLISSVGGN